MERLTADVRRQLLEQNEGFFQKTSYEAKNLREYRTYTIADGKLHIRATGKTSWADSRFDNTWVADAEETHRFLYNHQGLLDHSKLEGTRPVRASRQTLRPVSVPAAPVVDAQAASEAVIDTEENNRTFLAQLTPAQKLLFLAILATAAAGIYAAFRWGPPLWHGKVKPTTVRWWARLTRRDPGETS